MIYLEGQFTGICNELHHKLMDAIPVTTESWQALKNVPHTATRELPNVCIAALIPWTADDAALAVEPNLPWAEDHFQERVAGVPTNPGDQYMNWPWYQPGWAAQGGDEKFSHTYQERFWPKFAGRSVRATTDEGLPGERVPRPGIRYRYGDLEDLIALLYREPHTRQAYLPIWFPEDTGAHHGERVPCTLGYHFMLRGGLLHMTYFIRSCDFLRYFRDDVYMAMRLCQYVLHQLRAQAYEQLMQDEPDAMCGTMWDDVDPGILHMHMISLHVFEGDMPKMRREAPPRP